MNALVVGISADSAEVQKRFIDKFGLTLPMIPDTEKKVITAYGAREVLGLTAKRKTFLVDPSGVIAHIWPKVQVEGHGADVVATLRALESR